ncbi:hypothetical protein BBK36DRAFT_15989 [Trichoderma citrinoviride]|uniref:Uncharacterized protein n=1 Tax=Trichoderma citrinoviride TaxID=58853 RepID=A0A2T4BLV3_9HYPO|nr:hypothetical protein BBK36DRAFT_15989 [Trichoderma citrinoviride]PTB70295.1 hypothetical protein BBK36DRAFT_15989 [Trichoderma citrinoviride]
MTRLFQIVRPALKRSYQIIPDGEEPLYRVKNLPYPMSNKPDLALLDGPDDTAPVLVVCHMPKFSRHFKVGFGDPAGPEPIVWEDFIRPSMGSRERRISVSFSGDGHIVETGKGEREEFTWKRTRHASVPGKKLHSASLRNRKLVDSQGNILAIFTHVTAIGVAGWLQIQVDRGRDFDLMVMMTALSIHEWIRRRQ